MKYLVFIIVFLNLASCYPATIRSKFIPVEKIYGTYDLSNGKTITFLSDSTYTYSYPDSCGVMRLDVGIWKYQYFEATKHNQLKAFDMRAISETGVRSHFTEYQTFTFYFCWNWGGVVMSRGLPADPDGYWYEKIKQ
jgi:hypothetical protein